MQSCHLVVRDLACRRGDRILFQGVSFALNPGDSLHLKGPNGVGKSSLIRILAGLLLPFSGSVERNGSIGLLDERPSLDLHLPLNDALRFWERLDRNNPGNGDKDKNEWLSVLGLDQLGDVPVQYLSTGQRKRAGFARLLGQNPAIMLLDEPLNGLDHKAVATIEALTENHCRQNGICIIASHQSFALPGMMTLTLEDFAA